ncbi:MAG: HD domain-containing protein [Myxococcales bacterium]|nr:HD domain-containing protein [Myxococcales bacterium]
MEIRDPVHGPIAVSPVEERVIDTPWFQRLRGIKQLGFSELTFPGATHTRLLHSIGAMHLSGVAFDAVFRDAPWLPATERARLRQTVRLAMLCHDLGHPPLSHTSEVLLPTLGVLAVPGLPVAAPAARAGHEHMTLKLLLDSGLTDVIRTACAPLGIDAGHVASLLDDDCPIDAGTFAVAGRQLRGLLAALVSSELDCDRMDYLLRDSHFTGVSYGKFDADWLISHLGHVDGGDGTLHLCLDDRAVFSFDDFLLSRHHMFLMVYFHRKSVCYDHMLRAFYADWPDLCRATPDPDAWLRLDDAKVWLALRDHADRSDWARRIVARRPLRLVAEATAAGARDPVEGLADQLRHEGVPHLHVTSRGALSKYRPGDQARAIFVRRRPALGRPTILPIAEATRLYERYADTTVLERVYVAEEHLARVAPWLEALRGG